MDHPLKGILNKFQWFLVVGLLALILFSLGIANNVGEFLGMIASAILFSCAALVSGGLLGFLFGVPRTGASEAGTPQVGVGTPAMETVRANTNLEQVSDWLTKVLIGATLVQLGTVPSAAASCSRRWHLPLAMRL